ncbi:MAG: M20/M25/M40 family metallo-hydrolase [Victivallaceae bacterium]
MYTILRTRLDGMKDEIRDFLTRLIETPSPSTKEKRIADLVYVEMENLGFDKVYRDEAGNVIGVINGIEGAPTVVLNSHLDSVGCENTEPFRARCVGDRIYGAGASDCKGGLAAQVYTGEILKRCLLPLKGNLVVAATVAEENGCSVGVRMLLKETLPSLGLKPDYVILGEPTNLGLYYGHDGRVEFDIKLEGRDPFQVDDGARNIYREFAGNNPRHEEVDFQGLASFEPELSSSGGWRHARIHMEKKLHPDDSPEAVTEHFKHEAGLLLKTQKALALETMVVEERQKLFCGRKILVKHLVNAWQTDPFNPLMERARQSLAAAACEVKTGKWKLARPGMGTAGGMIRSEYGLPVIGYGPGEEEEAHTSNESVDFNKVSECVYGSASIVHGLIGIPVFGWTSDEI